MSRERIKILCVFLVVLGTAAFVLARTQSHYNLGKPGVKLGHVPLYDEKTNLVAQVSVLVPEKVPGFTSKMLPVTKLELNWLPADTVYGRRSYRSEDGLEMSLGVVLMGTDRTSIHKPEYCLLGQGWHIDSSEVVPVPMRKPFPYQLEVQKMNLSTEYRGEKIRGIYAYWFVADGELTPSHIKRMYWMGRDLLTTGKLQRWAYVSCLSACRPGGENALFERMKSFIADAVPEFQLVAGDKPVAEQSKATQTAEIITQ
jgi:hypothetical protein